MMGALVCGCCNSGGKTFACAFEGFSAIIRELFNKRILSKKGVLK